MLDFDISTLPEKRFVVVKKGLLLFSSSQDLIFGKTFPFRRLLFLAKRNGNFSLEFLG